MHSDKFHYSLSYGAPNAANVSSQINFVNTSTHAPTSNYAASGGGRGSLPMQLRTPGPGPSANERSLTITQGSDPEAIVVLYDSANQIIAAVNSKQFDSHQTPRVTFKNPSDIGAIKIVVDSISQQLDLRQAQNWLNQVQNLGVTVGFSNAGELIGSISNLDAVQNIYPDRDGVTLNTKCSYQINARGTQGNLYCA